jgi:hypothetical protein
MLIHSTKTKIIKGKVNQFIKNVGAGQHTWYRYQKAF